ncbi:MAG: IS66 family insertion sequence element accessory protein TnpB [Opitutaceae bacterium]
MFVDWSRVKVFVRPGSTDMRKQINGLAVLVEEAMAGEPLSGNLYLFSNQERRLVKLLYWERNGFCLWQKRLERDRFPWPRTEEAAREITCEQLRQLLDGIDFWNAHQRLEFSAVR